MQAILPNGQIAAITTTLLKLTEQNDMVQITAGENLVSLRVASKSIRLAVDLQAEVLEPGSATVRASKFLACSSAQKLNVLKIQSNPVTATISCETFRATLPVMDPAMFLPFPQIRDDHLIAAAPADELVHAFSVAQPCASNSGFDVWEDAFYIETSDTVGVIVCADRTHMASVKFPCAGAGFKCCIPQPLFLNCIDLAHEQITIKYTDNLIEFSAPHVSILSSIVAVMMPAIRPVMLPIRQQCIHSATFDRESFVTALTLAMKLESERPNYQAFFDFDEQACRLRCNGDREDEVNANLDGKATHPVRIHFDHRKMFNTIRNLTRLKILSNNVTLRYVEPYQAFFIDLDEEDDGQWYAMMPRKPLT